VERRGRWIEKDGRQIEPHARRQPFWGAGRANPRTHPNGSPLPLHRVRSKTTSGSPPPAYGRTGRRHQPSHRWGFGISIQRAGCETRTSGCVRGAEEQSSAPTRPAQPLDRGSAAWPRRERNRRALLGRGSYELGKLAPIRLYAQIINISGAISATRRSARVFKGEQRK
jgi:hypothetical protein